jgi:pimeloyl-ACP methyl ester carboxylesterase
VEFQAISSAEQRYIVSIAGEGPDVVLWHGFPDTPCSWRQTQAALVAAGWRVTVPWLRGYHPETIVAGRGYGPEVLGADALGLLDAIGAKRAVLVGHDWGALLAYLAASLAPERVRAIVTIAIPHPSVLEPTPAGLWEIRHFLALKLPWAQRTCRRNDFAYLEKLYRRWSPAWWGPERDQSIADAKRALASAATLGGAIAYYRALSLLRRSPSLAHAPAVAGLVIGGAHPADQRELFTRTAESLPPPSRALIVEGTGHWPHREREELVVSELLAFLAQIEA